MTATTLILAERPPQPAGRPRYYAPTAVLLAFAVFEVAKHGMWGAALLGVLEPDLSTVLGAGNGLAHGQLHPRAVASYNLVHHFSIPMALMTAASLDVIGLVWFIVGVTWCLHVALDRSLGYGLRDRDGFQRGR